MHDLWDVETKGCFECSLPLVLGVYVDVMVPPSDVKGGEQNLSIKVFQNLLYSGNGVDVADSPTVYDTVVL